MEPQIEQVVLDNFARLDEVTQAWLKQVGQLPSQRQALRPQAPPQPAAPPSPSPEPNDRPTRPPTPTPAEGGGTSTPGVRFAAQVLQVDMPPKAEN